MGQSKVHLEFESGGPRIGWVALAPSAPPDSASKWDAKSYDLDSGPSGEIVYVLDTASGNLAERQVSDAGKAWLVKDSDFKKIGAVKVRVEHEGKAVQVADVVLSDGVRTQNEVVDPTSNGVAQFYDVKAGNVNIEVSYHSGGASKSQKQGFTLDLKRDTAVPLLVVSITAEVLTIAAPSATGTASQTSGGTQASPSSQPGSALPPTPVTPQQKKVGDYAVVIFGILFAAAVIWGGYLWLQKNHGTAQGALQKVGLSLHDPSPFDPTLSAPINSAATPAPPQPQQQILLSGATPTPLAPISQPMAVATPAAVASSPHFTRDSGEVFQLAEGSSTLGRDDSVPLSFPAETSLSRRHAEVVRNGAQVIVRDLGSTNGTFVNGAKIAGDTTLRPGDNVQFGMVRFRYEG